MCAHCGQPLPDRVPSYGAARTNKPALLVTLLLHLLLVAIYLLQPAKEKHASPASGTTMVYLAPLAGKPKPKPQQRAPRPVKSAPPVRIKRLPNTITLPNEKPVEVVERPEPKPVAQPPAEDMAAYIEARRRQRGAGQGEPASEESENDRAMRIAKANIAAANGRSAGDERNDTGGVFQVNKSYHSAEVKFRGWNTNFKRRWLQQVTVEQGTEIDIETAVIKKMIELIRKEKKGDFDWDSHRLQRVVRMSARLEDTAQLHAFLMKEMFPEYMPPRR